MTTSAPWMASPNSFYRHPGSFENSVLEDRLFCIVRASGSKSTSTRKIGRNGSLIELNGKYKDLSYDFFHLTKVRIKFA